MTTAVSINSQIVYHDISPDINLINNDTFNLDLDNNGIADFQFRHYSISPSNPMMTYSGGYYTSLLAYLGAVYPLQSNNGFVVDSYSYAANLASGVQVGPVANFDSSIGILGGFLKFYSTSSTIVTSTSSYTFSNFLGQEGYLGIQFSISGANHYGWIRCEVSSDGKRLTVKDYAYQNIVNYPIAAGATFGFVTEVEDNLLSDIRVTKEFNQLVVNGKNEYSVEILSIDGKSVFQSKGDSVLKIDVSNYVPGIYMVKIIDDKNRLTTKRIYL